jgi:hypothetical protein
VCGISCVSSFPAPLPRILPDLRQFSGLSKAHHENDSESFHEQAHSDSNHLCDWLHRKPKETAIFA